MLEIWLPILVLFGNKEEVQIGPSFFLTGIGVLLYKYEYDQSVSLLGVQPGRSVFHVLCRLSSVLLYRAPSAIDTGEETQMNDQSVGKKQQIIDKAIEFF